MAGVHVRVAVLLLCSFRGLAQPSASGAPAAKSTAQQSDWRHDLSPELKDQLRHRLADLRNKTDHALHIMSESGNSELRGLEHAHTAAESRVEQKFRKQDEHNMRKQAGAEEALHEKLQKLKDASEKKQEKLEQAEQERLEKLKKEYNGEEERVLDKFQHEAEKAWINQFQQPPEATSMLTEMHAAVNMTQAAAVNGSNDWWKVLSADEEKKLKESLEDLKESLQEHEEVVENKTQKKLEAVQDEFSRKEKKAVDKLTRKIEKMQRKEIKAKEKLQQVLEKLQTKSKSTQKKLEEVGPEIVQRLKDEYEEKKEGLEAEFKEKAEKLKKEQEQKEEEKAEKLKKEQEQKEEEMAKENATKAANAANSTQEAQSSQLASEEPKATQRNHGFELGVIMLAATALVRSSDFDSYDGPPPPDEVAEAYALLNLPLSALRDDVQRRSRALARERHPDKAPPDQRVRATRLFRQLQDAKAKILSWLRQRSVPQLEESDDSPCLDSADEGEEDFCRPPEVVFGEAGDVLADFEQDGSGSELEKEDQKAACVYRGRGDSPDTFSSSEESGEEKAETALALRSRGIIRTEDSALVQATACEPKQGIMASSEMAPLLTAHA
ncbi:NAA25 [Symbiodinium pilosum]|uniref:NAA25 protein n=1 Tax=Symbiodinium pilosum TaxID=2952 RepID=A0A812UBF6_SYMPI|nr:NAA25 [Symbiodinium pilosum]